MPARSPWLVLAVVSSALFLIVIDMTVLYTALPTLTRDLGASATEKLWIVNAYSLVVAGLLPGAGALGDRFGHRRMFVIGLAVFGAASLAAGFAPSSAALIAARAGLAVGAAAMMPATLSIIRQTFDDPDRRALAIGIWAAVASGGAALGPVVGGVLLQHFHWGAVFLVNLPVVAAALVLTPILVPRGTAHGHHPFDPTGSVQALVGLIGVTLAIKEIARPDPSAPLALAAAAVGVSALALFLRRQRGPDPMIDLTLFRDPRFAGGVIGALVSAAALLGVQLAITQRLQLVEGLSPLQAGLHVLPLSLAAFAAGPLAGMTMNRIGTGRLLAAALALGGAGVLAYGLGLGRPGVALASFAVMGAGIGAAMTAASSAIMLNAPARRAGMAASIEEVSYELGGAMGIALLGSLLAGIYSATLGAMAGATDPLAVDSLDGALMVAATLPGPDAARLVVVATAAFDRAAGAVALAAGLMLLAAALWIGRRDGGRGRTAGQDA